MNEGTDGLRLSYYSPGSLRILPELVFASSDYFRAGVPRLHDYSLLNGLSLMLGAFPFEVEPRLRGDVMLRGCPSSNRTIPCR
jgi:hypothetical protein